MGKGARLREMQHVVASIQQRWGDRAIRPARQAAEAVPLVLSTGLLAVDQALGIGGWPKGRISELVTVGSSGQAALVATPSSRRSAAARRSSM